MGATAPEVSTQKVVDNIYCALLGRYSTSVANGHEGVARGRGRGLITDILDGKEYGTKFGEQGVPQPSLTQGESDGLSSDQPTRRPPGHRDRLPEFLIGCSVICY